MESQLPHADTPRLADYLRPILGRIWLIVAILVVVTTATYAYYQRQAPSYEATTQVFLGSEGDPLANGVTSGSDRNIENQAQLFSSAEVLARVARTVNYNGAPRDLLERATITPTKGSDVIVVKARAGEPQAAARLANAFADAFIGVGSAKQQAQLEKTIRGLRSQLDDIPNRPDNENDRLSISSRLRQLQLARRTASAPATQVGRASAPDSPVAPKPARNAIFAFALALIASVGLAFGLERFDRRVRRVEDAEALYELPILAVVPHSDDINHMVGQIAGVSPTVKESFHQLRANLRLSALDQPPRKILVTSGLPGEGKSTVVRNLAIVFREWGQRVAVVDADLRNPNLGRLFGVQPERGLTDLLTGDSTLLEAMTIVPVEALGLGMLERIYAHSAGAQPERGRATTQRSESAPSTITLIGPGPRPASPPAVLSAAATQHAFDEILKTHDIVLIDSPPLLAVSDTTALLPEVDAVVLVSRLTVTTKDSARRTTELIARVRGTRVAGLVVNDLSKLAGIEYGYGYGGEYGSSRS